MHGRPPISTLFPHTPLFLSLLCQRGDRAPRNVLWARGDLVVAGGPGHRAQRRSRHWLAQRRLELAEELRAHLAEGRLQLRRHGLAGARVFALRIRRPPVHQELIVQVWTRSETRRAHIADDLLLGDALSHMESRGEAREVAVAGPNAIGVPELDQVAIPAVAAGLRDDPVRGGADRRAVRRRVVGALVGSPALEDRMEAPADAARDMAEAQRRPQKRAAQRAATIVVEAG